jgi:NAD(P)-dependent dehydrogenase (short-subunit alcohol dehydrogenase family)
MSMLAEQAAIVTGGGRGIGRAIARRFADEGATVAVFDIDGETASATAHDVGGIARRVDISDPDAVGAAVADVAAELGRIDILVNNAGVEARAPFLEITRQDWQRQIDVNLSGTFYCSQAAAAVMAERGYGRIVNLSSVAGLIGPIDLAAYGAAKAGIVGLTRAATLDLADYGITVNAIASGRPRHCASGRSTVQSRGSGRSTRSRTRRSSWPRPRPVSSPASRCPSTEAPSPRGPYMVEKYRRRRASS